MTRYRNRSHLDVSPTFFEQVAKFEADRIDFVLATVIESGGSTPRTSGAKMIVTETSIIGTIGGGAVEHKVILDSRKLLDDPSASTAMVNVHLVRDLAMCCGGKMSIFLEKIASRPKLWIFGAGHVGTELAQIADRSGFDVVVVDDRSEWADPSRFNATVRVVEDDPETVIKNTPPSADDYVVVVTHEHALDEILMRCLSSIEPKFIGMIGSRGKWAKFTKRLRARGVTSNWLERVSCPVGIDIGAETPTEIALSIVAQLIRKRRDGPKWS